MRPTNSGKFPEQRKRTSRTEEIHAVDILTSSFATRRCDCIYFLTSRICGTSELRGHDESDVATERGRQIATDGSATMISTKTDRMRTKKRHIPPCVLHESLVEGGPRPFLEGMKASH